MTAKAVFLRPLHIVHVEDQQVPQGLIRGILAASKYPEFRVHQFVDIQSAETWALPNTSQLDCLLLDLMLADTEGMDTFLRAVRNFSRIPIVVVTAYIDVDLAYQLVSSGADNYLPKPSITAVNLPLVITAAIARRSRLLPAGFQLQESLATLQTVYDRARQHRVEGKHD